MPVIDQIIPPHAPDAADKIASLIAAYEANEAVPPVVVLTFADNAPCAICGSHRLAALVEGGWGDEEIDDSEFVIIVDGDDLIEQLQAIADDEDHDHDRDASLALEAIERLLNNRSIDFGDLASALIACGVLSPEAAAALEDQQ